MTTGYAKEDVLVDSDWAQEHLDDPNVRFVEVDVDTTAYEQSHIPGAVGWNWTSQLSDGIRRDIAIREDFSKLLSESGHRPGHHDRPLRRQQQLVRRLGVLAAQAVRPRGRQDPQRRAQVLARQGPAAHDRRAVVRRRPATSCPSPTSACARSATTSCRASATPSSPSLTCARPPSSTARSSRRPGMTETAQRAGHIPGAASIPWAQTVNEDGTFKDADDLARSTEQGRDGRQGRHRLLPHRRAVVATSWFVLHELLGFERVRNYDGSWTEWGSMVGVPIEKPVAVAWSGRHAARSAAVAGSDPGAVVLWRRRHGRARPWPRAAVRGRVRGR